MSGIVANGKLKDLEDRLQEARALAQEIEEEISAQHSILFDLITQNVSFKELDIEALHEWAKRFYVILPKPGVSNEYWVIVPRFIPFHVGWLERQTDGYNIFVINKYIDWISPLPSDIKTRIDLEPYLSKAIIHDRGDKTSILEVDPDEYEQAWAKYKDKLTSRVPKTQDQIYITKDKEWELLAELIQDGMLPFEPRPVEDEDLRPDRDNIKLRDYQIRAWEKLLDYGAIGVFWAPGAGKTFLALYAGNRIKGKKLVVVPTATLREQWSNRIKQYSNRYEWDVQTYAYITQHHMRRYTRNEYALTIFDEAHHLPATTFSKLATLKTKYRIGLSASPYREDGRTEYIFALTGFPVGLKWRELISLGVVREPDVKVYLYSTGTQKRNDLKNLLAERTGKIVIFCDLIIPGKSLSRELKVPFVYGETTNRLDIIAKNRVVIVSRVGDEGLSIHDLDTVIEYDFHGGSRRQEAQRAGRLMHSMGEGEHIVMMTERELEKYEKRLYSLEEQGFRIRYERR